MDRTKAMERISKCMALSKSPNEHEAAAAMRQAQKLMEMFDISEKELGIVGMTQATVQCPIQAGKKVPVVLNHLMALVTHAFGVRSVVSRSMRETDYGFDVNYFGPEHRVMLAEYTHVVIQRAVDKAYKTYLVENPDRRGVHGVRAGFYIGWLDGIRETVDEFAWTDEDKNGTTALIEKTYGTALKKVQSGQRYSGSAANAGGAASEGFALHRPMGTERLKIGN